MFGQKTRQIIYLRKWFDGVWVVLENWEFFFNFLRGFLEIYSLIIIISQHLQEKMVLSPMTLLI